MGSSKTNPQTSPGNFKNKKSHKEVFTDNNLKYWPIFYKNKHCCRRWASKGHFFKDCKNSASNWDCPIEINASYNDCHKKCRKVSANNNWSIEETPPPPYYIFNRNRFPPPRDKVFSENPNDFINNKIKTSFCRKESSSFTTPSWTNTAESTNVLFATDNNSEENLGNLKCKESKIFVEKRSNILLGRYQRDIT